MRLGLSSYLMMSKNERVKTSKKLIIISFDYHEIQTDPVIAFSLTP